MNCGKEEKVVKEGYRRRGSGDTDSGRGKNWLKLGGTKTNREKRGQ